MRLLFIILVILNITSISLYSQRESPIDLEEQDFKRIEIGIMLGLGQNFQSGSYYVDCTECEFTNGLKFGYTLGAFVDYYLNEKFSIGVMGLYDDFGINASYIEVEGVTPINTPDVTIPVGFRHESEFSLNTFTIAPNIKWHVANFFFLRAAFAGVLPLSSNLTHTKILLDKFVTMQNGQIVEISLRDYEGDRAELQNGEVEGVNSFQFGILPGMGFNIPFSNRTTFSTSFQYYLPLSNVYSASDDFRINSWRIFFELNFAIQDSEK